MNNLCLRILLFILSVMICRCMKSCQLDWECNSKTDKVAVKCAVCVSVSSTSSECLMPFDETFKTNSLCDFISCKEETCTRPGVKNGGVCGEIGKHKPFCFCSEPYYGKNCEHIWPNISEFEISAPLAVKWDIMNFFIAPVIWHNTKFTIALRKKIHYTKYNIIIRNRFGFYQGNYDFNISKDPNKNFNAKIEGEMRFPFLQYHAERKKCFAHSDDVKGYVSSVRMQIFSTVINKEIFNDEYSVFVSYDNVSLKCMPVISLSNCETDGDISVQPGTTVAYHRQEAIEIGGIVKFVEDGRRISTTKHSWKCSQDGVHYHWTIWKMRTSHREKTSKIYTEKFGEQISSNITYYFKPYTLDFGSYKVLLEVKKAQYEMPISNFAYCYFSVRYLPLEAYIEGGSERKVIKELGIELSAIRSRDPNQPRNRQDHIKVEWSCSETESFCAAKEMKLSEIHRIPPSNLRYNAKYNFTLKVWTDIYNSKCGLDCSNIKPAYAYCIIEVAGKNDTANSAVSIRCISNCRQKVVVNRILFLRIESAAKDLHGSHFNWKFSVNGNKMVSADSIKFKKRQPSTMFIVKENILVDGAFYRLFAMDEKLGMYAVYSFETEFVNYSGNCSVMPTNVVKGQTVFDCKCTLRHSLIYEFYDKSDDDNDNLTFTGRMLGSSRNGIIREVFLTRGNVFVYIYNTNGFFTSITIKVHLEDRKVDSDVMNGLLENVPKCLILGSITKTLAYISFIPDIVPPEIEKQKVLEILLNTVTQLRVETIYDVKLCTSSLYNVLTTLNKPTQLILSLSMIIETISFIERQSIILKKFMFDTNESQWMSPSEIKTVTEALLTCLYVTVMSKNTTLKTVNEDELSLKELSQLRKGSITAVNILELVQDTLIFLQRSGQPPTRIWAAGGKLIVWIMIDDYEYPTTHILKSYKETVLSLNKPNFCSLKNNSDTCRGDLKIKFAIIKDNLFCWFHSDVHSNVVSLSLALIDSRDRLIQENTLIFPVTLKIDMDKNVEREIVNNTLIQLDSTLKEGDIDLKLAVHRFDPPVKSITIVKFNFPPTTDPLRVLILENHRPNYDIILKDSKLITKAHPRYPVSFKKYEKSTFLFMSVLPGSEVPVGKNVSYQFEVSTKLCQTCVKGLWTTEGCNIIHGDDVECECTHLSIFAAAFPRPPVVVDPFSDVRLFVTVLENPMVVTFVTAVLIFYLILDIWAWNKDMNDKTRRSAIVLEDNFPGDKYPYMIAVYTSPRLNAGTTAHVCLRIIGTNSSSRSHFLCSKNRKVLKRNFDDWFIILCPSPLGEIKGVHIWHDNAGSSPDWFCDKIYVYDLLENTETLFMIEQWLALRPNEFPEATVIPATKTDVNSIKRLFLDNSFAILRETHSLASILLRHPRSQGTRLQRISFLMTCVMLSMICSIMFFKPDDDQIGIDDYEYRIGSRELFISIECLLVNITVSSLVLLAFRKSYKQTAVKPNSSTMVLRKGNIGEISNYLSAEKLDNKPQRNKRNLNVIFVGLVTNRIKGRSLSPIGLQSNEEIVKVRRLRLTFAWILCLSIILLCSYLVMLYGLHLGSAKSKKWLTTVLMTFGLDMFITEPAKTVFFAIWLSVLFQSSVSVNVHQVSSKDVNIYKPPNDDRYFQKLLTKRTNVLYSPLPISARERLLRKKVVRDKWLTLFTFLLALLFGFVVSAITSHIWTSLFYPNHQARQLVHYYNNPNSDAISITEVQSISSMEQYLENTFVNTFYNIKWYNNMLFDDKHVWSSDFTYKFVGLPMIRQKRVISTTIEDLNHKIMNCSPKFSTSDEDTRSYDVRWEPLIGGVKKTDFAWKYTKVDEKFLFAQNRLYGESGRLYDKSGYMTNLDHTRKKTSHILAALRANSWQDRQTRVLFLEFTLYNVNYRLFTEVTLIVEYLFSGMVLHKTNVISVKAGSKYDPLEIVFLTLIIYYLIVTIYQCNHQGFLVYVSKLKNVYQLLIVVLGILGTVVFCVNIYRQSSYFEPFTKDRMSDHFDFDTFIFHFLQLKIILSLLLCVAILRIPSVLRGKRSLSIYYYNFIPSIPWIIWLTVIVMIILVALKETSILLNMMFIRWKELVITHRCTRYITPEELEHSHVKVFIAVRTILICTVMWCFVILFMNYAKAARIGLSKSKGSDFFGFISFVKSRFDKGKKTCKHHSFDNCMSIICLK